MKVEVSLTPTLYPSRTIKSHHVTVVIDILRATTAICAAFQAGCSTIVPLDSLDGLASYRDKGYRLAAERNGSKVGDAEYGNSPTEYLRHDLTGGRLAYSTTNGTRSLLMASDAECTVVGAFANISALERYLREKSLDVVLLCSGWKGDFCLEDSVFAGAMVSRLAGLGYQEQGDAAHMVGTLWEQAAPAPYAYCAEASHVHRLRGLGVTDDIPFAFQPDTCPVVPRLSDGVLTL